MSEESWDNVVDTNLKGAVFMAKEASIRLAKAKQPGSIINISSILGARQSVGNTSYGASKSGLIHVTKTMALELVRYNIRVNAILPGYFMTEMNAEYFQTEKGTTFIKGTPAGQ